MNIEDRVERLNTFINEDRIVRGYWTGVDGRGRETACLLAALSPEVVEHDGNASACPASVMPAWFAFITPWIDDNASEAAWPSAIRRYAVCAARWSVLDDAAWRRVEIAARRAAVVEAMSYTTDEQVLDAGREVLAWLAEGMPEPSLNMAAKAEDAAAMLAAAWAAKAADVSTAAMLAAAWAAKAADVSTAAMLAAKWAVDAALRAAAAAKESSVVAAAAQRATADRITDAILSALEAECG
jgi:hypothetical protein